MNDPSLRKEKGANKNQPKPRKAWANHKKLERIINQSDAPLVIKNTGFLNFAVNVKGACGIITLVSARTRARLLSLSSLPFSLSYLP